MAELLVVVVVVVLLLMYAADRARKLRVRARQLSGMNDRLDAAVAKVDEEQQQKRAVVRASAELTSVMPAIKRPPLTIPGMAGHGDAADEPDGETAADAVWPAGQSWPAGEVPAAQAGPPARPPADTAGDSPDTRAARGTEPAAASAERVAAPPVPRVADDTLSMPAAIATDGMPVPKIPVTSDGTLIMRPVPDHGPVPAGEAPVAPDGIRDERAARQDQANRHQAGAASRR
jgi:hypothetical protein